MENRRACACGVLYAQLPGPAGLRPPPPLRARDPRSELYLPFLPALLSRLKTRSSSDCEPGPSLTHGTVKSVDDMLRLGASFYYTKTKMEKAGQVWTVNFSMDVQG